MDNKSRIITILNSKIRKRISNLTRTKKLDNLLIELSKDRYDINLELNKEDLKEIIFRFLENLFDLGSI